MFFFSLLLSRGLILATAFFLAFFFSPGTSAQVSSEAIEKNWYDFSDADPYPFDDIVDGDELAKVNDKKNFCAWADSRSRGDVPICFPAGDDVDEIMANADDLRSFVGVCSGGLEYPSWFSERQHVAPDYYDVVDPQKQIFSRGSLSARFWRDVYYVPTHLLSDGNFHWACRFSVRLPVDEFSSDFEEVGFFYIKTRTGSAVQREISKTKVNRISCRGGWSDLNFFRPPYSAQNPRFEPDALNRLHSSYGYDDTCSSQSVRYLSSVSLIKEPLKKSEHHHGNENQPKRRNSFYR